MQFEPVPLVPELPKWKAVAPLTPGVALSVTVMPLLAEPIWPAPATVDWVGGLETATTNRPALQPEHETACPATIGRALAARPLKVSTLPLIEVVVAVAA